jgi:cell fate regulator YaaT (PSP1 superfamily)
MPLTYYKVAVSAGIRLECVDDGSHNLSKNDLCIIECDRYVDYGRILWAGPPPDNVETKDLPVIQRRATLKDQSKAHENDVRGRSFHRKSTEIIERHGLPMRLVNTHISFDRRLSILLFTAPGRVDFRELLKDLNRALNCRVQLRQIGPRDQAGLIGGIGSCGRALCCSTFLTNFVSINVKMAKVQGVTLNPSSIIGACGRLKCCLDYEYEGYKALVKEMPRIGTRCKCDGCDGRIIDRNVLDKTVKVALEDAGGKGGIVTVPVSEVELES